MAAWHFEDRYVFNNHLVKSLHLTHEMVMLRKVKGFVHLHNFSVLLLNSTIISLRGFIWMVF